MDALSFVYEPVFWLWILISYIFGMYEGARITRKNGQRT